MKLIHLLLEMISEAGGKVEITDNFFVEFNQALQRDPAIKKLLEERKNAFNIVKGISAIEKEQKRVEEELAKVAAEKLINAIFIKLFGKGVDSKYSLKYITTPDVEGTVFLSSKNSIIDGQIKAQLAPIAREPRPYRVMPQGTLIFYKINKEQVPLWVPDDHPKKDEQYRDTIKKDIDKDAWAYKEVEKGENIGRLYRRITTKGEEEVKSRPGKAPRSVQNKVLFRGLNVGKSEKEIEEYIDDYKSEKIDDPFLSSIYATIGKMAKEVLKASSDEDRKEQIGYILDDILSWAAEADFIGDKDISSTTPKIEIKTSAKSKEIQVTAKQTRVELVTYINKETGRIDRSKTKLLVKDVDILNLINA